MQNSVQPMTRGQRLRRMVTFTSALTLGLALSSVSFAQSFPSKPIRIVVPAAAGGNLDLVSRNIAQKLSEQMGQPVVVENRPGGPYKIAVDFVAKAPADGYTYLAIADSFLYTPMIKRTAGFDPLKDFTGVGMVAMVPQILVVHPSVPANSVTELIALAKRRPGELNYGSSGAGATGHIAAELFNMQAGISMTHVPYKGNAPALIDLVGGRLSLMFDTISTSASHVRAGTLKSLGVTTLTRSSILPNVPTVNDSGLPGYEAAIFNGFVALTGTPPDILKRMNTELRKAVQQPDIRSRMQEQGVDLVASESPDQFTDFMKKQSEKYARVVKTANIRAD